MPCTAAARTVVTLTASEFGLFRDLIYKHAGIALKDSKRRLVASRLAGRLRALGLSSYTQYWHYLRTSDFRREELRRMINCLTTNKTSFFREPDHYPILAKHMLARVQAGQPAYRIWSAACSTGQEPYSLAMTALGGVASFAPLCTQLDVSILASDIDTDVLAAAERAIYPLDAVDDVDEALRRRFFLRGLGECEGHVQVKDVVRRMVQFRQINLVHGAWPVHGPFDAIFCRNVIIYFDRDTQRSLFHRLGQCLSPEGLLFVGSAETLGWLEEVLVPVCHSVYRLRERGKENLL